MSVRKDFLDEARKIKREGVSNLLSWLELETDFFDAPASTKFHGNHPEGLILHSMAVLDVMRTLASDLDLVIDKDSVTICGLFHDVCKVNFYERNDEPPSAAQVNYMLDLCEKKGITPVPKNSRTKPYISAVISALKDGEEMPAFKESYKVNDKLPMGHGEKSVYLIQKHMKLTDEEALAMRWHLGGFDPGIHFSYPSGFPCLQACKENKLVGLMITADFAASYLIDEW